MQEIIGKSLGSFEVISQIGAGGTAKVYKAYQPSMDRHVALKVLSGQYKTRNETLLKRFLQEAQVVAKLEHPHILPVHEFGETDGYFYIAMRLVETGTLADRFHGQPLPLDNICQIITQVGDALDYAHSEGVVHRDIKLKNILMDQRDNCLLTDFGIAKVLASDAHITQTGKTLGTPTYMSPEQIRGEKLDGRSDIYALGVVLYQLATGQPPYDADVPNDILLRHLQDPLPAPRNHNPDLPAALEKVIIKTLAKNREERYTTANEMAGAVEAALSDITPTLTDEEGETTKIRPPLEIAKPPANEEEDSETTVVLSEEDTLEPSLGRRGWKKKTFIVAGVIISLLLLGAALFPLFRPPSSSVLPQPGGGRPPALSGSWQLQLEDTFDDKGLQLDELNQDGIRMGYENGQYVMSVDSADDIAISSLDGIYGDFIVEIEATQLRGSEESSYGLLLREQRDDFYSFEISTDGVISFYKSTEEADTILFGQESGVIQNNGPNTIRIKAAGPRFILFVNGENIGEVINEDRNLRQGGISLIVTTLDTSGGTDVAFDNLKIWTLDN